MITSSVTERFQTTLPKGVRDALGIRRGDTLAYELNGDQVMVKRGGPRSEEDPVLLGFLDLLERDIARRPDRLGAVPEALVERARNLVAGVAVDLDAPL